MPPSGICSIAEAAAAFPKNVPSVVLRAGKAANEPANTAIAAAPPRAAGICRNVSPHSLLASCADDAVSFARFSVCRCEDIRQKAIKAYEFLAVDMRKMGAELIFH